MAAGRLKIDIRRKKILELLVQNGQVTVTELSELLSATQTTIPRHHKTGSDGSRKRR